MTIIRNQSLQTLLTILLFFTFILLWSVMTWREYQDFKSDIISSSIDFINQDLASLQLEMQYEAIHTRERALSRRGVNTKYKTLASIDDKGNILHALQLAYTNQSALDTLPAFDTLMFSKVQRTHKKFVSLDSNNHWITAYFPLVLERHNNEIRATDIGVLYAIYDLSQENIKINWGIHFTGVTTISCDLMTSYP